MVRSASMVTPRSSTLIRPFSARMSWSSTVPVTGWITRPFLIKSFIMSLQSIAFSGSSALGQLGSAYFSNDKL